MSQDLKVVLRIDGETGKVQAEVKDLEKELKGAATAGSKAGKETSKSFKEAETSASNLNKRIGSIKNALIGLGALGIGAKIAKDIVKAGDEYKSLNARIDLVTKSQEEFNRAQQGTFDIAQETRVSLGSTVELYTRLERALQDQAVAQNDVLDITRTVSQALSVSGATAQETASVMLQLSQGLASGVVRGQEFNAVAEGGSRIMQALKEDLNKTSGELREMAFAGELTTEVVTRALINQSDAIGSEFAKLPVTVEGALQRISNANTKYFGELDQSVGITDTLSEGLIFLSENLDDVYDAVGKTAEIMLVLAGAAGIQALIGGLGTLSLSIAGVTAGATAMGAALKAAIISNPIAATLVGSYAAWEGLTYIIDSHNEKINEMSELTGDAKDAYDSLTVEMSKGFESDNVDVYTQSLDVLKSELESVRSKLAELNAERERENQLILGSAIGSKESNLFGAVVALRGQSDEQQALKLKEQNINATIGLANAQKFLTDTFGPLYEAAKKQIELDEQAQEVAAGNTESVNAWIESADKQLLKLQQQNAQYGLSATAIIKLNAEKIKEGITDAKRLKQIDDMAKALINEQKQIDAKKQAIAEQNEAISLAIELNKEYATESESLDDIKSERIRVIKLLTDNQEALSAAGIDVSKTIEQVNKKAKEQTSTIKGVNDVWDDYYDLMQKLGMIDEVAFEFTQMELTLEELERSGKLSKQQLDALRDAMYQYRAAADSGTEGTDEFVKSIRGINGDGVFNNDANFEYLIEQGLTLKEILLTAANGFGEGMTAAMNSTNVLMQGYQWLEGIWDSTSGQDNEGRILDSLAQVSASGALGPVAQAIAQVAQTINSITGGKLFGTSYETESSATNITLDRGGITGTNIVTEVRERSLFRGREWQETVTAISADMQAALDSYYDQIILMRQQAASALGTTTSTDVVTGAYTEQYDANGNLTKQGSTFGGRFFDEDSTAFELRAMAENLLSVLVESFGSGVNQIADRWRGNAADLLDGTQLLLQAGADINAGVGLFDTLKGVVTVITDMAEPGEALADAYSRVQGSVILLDDVFDTLGVAIDATRVEYVRLAADIATAAGGIPEARELWSNIFDNFYTEDELNDIRLNQSSELLGQQAQNLGIDPSLTMEQFRALFNEQLPNLTAEQMVGWLEFADTLVIVNELQEQRNAGLLEEAEALQEYNQFAQSLEQQLSQLDGTAPSDFIARLQEIDLQHKENIATLQELATAAGLAEPAEKDLAVAHRIAALQTQEAIGILQDATQSLIDELYGEQAQSQVEDFSSTWQSGISSVSQAGNNLFGQWESALQRIDDYTNSLLTNEQLSPLEAPERLEQARNDFYDLVAAANSGDLEAAQQVQPALQEFLQILRDVERSGDDYNSEFYEAIAAAQGITAPTGLGNGEPVLVGPSQQYIDYTNQQRIEDAEAMAIHRLELSQALAVHVAELAEALNRPVLELFTTMGGDIEQFLTDLGIDVGAATGETTAMLAKLAQTLNIQVTELASSVELSLGSLADAQSLLNDGLEFTIDQLPQGIQDTLEPLLKDVENAADGTQQELALAALNSATSALPSEYRNQLAPYFESIDATSEAQETVSELRSQTFLLDSIAKNIEAANQAAGIPSYDVGTPFVPSDQIAQIHKGEMIVPAKEASVLRGMGVSVSSNDNKSVVAELQAVKYELQSMKAMQREKMEEQTQIQSGIKDNTGKERPSETPIPPRTIKQVCAG